MPYALGIDLGTTFTAAAIARDGRVEVVPLGNHAATIPTMVFLRDDDDVLIGDAAERRGIQEPERLAREFKRRLGDTAPILLDRTPFSSERLMAVILRHIVADISQRQGEPPSGIAVSHPANWGDFKTDLLRQAVQLAGLSEVSLIAEPVAAAVQYASSERVDTGEIIAVYDLGGGTFDAAVLRKTPSGFELLGRPQGIERLGGIDFDEAVFAHVRRIVGDAINELDTTDPGTRAALARLRQECVTAKETLSSDSDATVAVMLSNLQTQVRITRAEFEDMIRPLLRETLDTTRRAIEQASCSVDKLKAVLLAGGSSRIPLVSEMVRAEFSRPVVSDTHPKHSVALGAARLAADAQGRRGATLAPPQPASAAPAAPAAPTPTPGPPTALPPGAPPPTALPPAAAAPTALLPAAKPAAALAAGGRSAPRRNPRLLVGVVVVAALTGIGLAIVLGGGGDKNAASDTTSLGSSAATNQSSPDTSPTTDPDSTLDAGSTVDTTATTETAAVTTTTSPLTCGEASGLCVGITSIEAVDGAYLVRYEVQGFDPLIAEAPNAHVHFYYDTTSVEQAGLPGTGPWVVWDRPSGGGELLMNALTDANIDDFNGAGATAICVAVANADHSIQQDTASCFAIPDVSQADAALASAAEGRTTVVNVIAPAGGGCSTALHEAADAAAARGFLILRAQGRPADDVAYLALHQLLRPIRHRIAELCPDHSIHLEAVVTLSAPAPDGRAVQIGLLQLLGALAEQEPVCIVVDDADLADQLSLAAISFALGRLAADRVAAFLGGRVAAPVTGATEVRLAPWSVEALTQLLVTNGVASDVAGAIAAAADGLPGMAQAMAAGLTGAERTAQSALPTVLRPTGGIAARYHARLSAFDAGLQRALMVIAADEHGSVEAVRRALATLGEPTDGIERAEAEAIVELEGLQMRFTDPWLRPVAYYLLAPASRRAAHRALAAAYDRPDQAPARAWHLALAATAPSEEIAASLSLIAADQQLRGATLAAARTLQRAAEFSVDGAGRTDRLLQALQLRIRSRDLAAARTTVALLDVHHPASALAAAATEVLAAAATEVLAGSPLRAAGEQLDDPTDQHAVWWQGQLGALHAVLEAADGGRHSEALTMGCQLYPDHVVYAHALAHRRAGRIGAALDLLVTVGTVPESVLQAQLQLLHADLVALLGRGDEARALLGAMPQVAMAEQHHLTRRIDVADAMSAEQAPVLVAVADSSGQPRASLMARMGETVRRGDLAGLEVVLDRFAELQLPIELGEGHIVAAQVAAGAGNSAAAAAHRKAARLVLHGCGVRLWDRRLAYDDSEPSVVDEPLRALSAAEMRVAQAIADGMTNREAAIALFLSVKTVDFHLQQIYRKLTLRSRTELALRVRAAQPSTRGGPR